MRKFHRLRAKSRSRNFSRLLAMRTRFSILVCGEKHTILQRKTSAFCESRPKPKSSGSFMLIYVWWTTMMLLGVCERMPGNEIIFKLLNSWHSVAAITRLLRVIKYSTLILLARNINNMIHLMALVLVFSVLVGNAEQDNRKWRISQ